MPNEAEIIEIGRGMLRRNVVSAWEHGLGRNIVTCQSGGIRLVAVGGRMFRGTWRSFPEFLVEYLFRTLGEDWVLAQLSLSDKSRHPIASALGSVIEIRESRMRFRGLCSRLLSPCLAVTLPLAHDLYLIEHHALSIDDREALARLVGKLQSAISWRGARHEARVAAILIRAGFQIDWEDETRGNKGGHPEFHVRHTRTKKRYWVECKRDHSQPGRLPSVGRQLGRALKKQTILDRLIFIETDVPPESFQLEKGGWPVLVVNSIRKMELQPKSRPLPSAHVFVTNFHDGEPSRRDPSTFQFLVEGFKTKTFRFGCDPTLEEDIEQTEMCPEVALIFSSMKEHTHIPSSFGSVDMPPSDSGRPKIGDIVRLVDGRQGRVILGAAFPEYKTFAIHLLVPGGLLIFGKYPMSDSDLANWQFEPLTFFGEPLVPVITSSDSKAEIFQKIYKVLAGATEQDYRALLAGNGADIQRIEISIAALHRATAFHFTKLHLKHMAIPLPKWLSHLKPVPKNS